MININYKHVLCSALTSKLNIFVFFVKFICFLYRSRNTYFMNKSEMLLLPSIDEYVNMLQCVYLDFKDKASV